MNIDPESASKSVTESGFAFLSVLAGFILLIKKEKALTGVGLVVFAIVILLFSYYYLVPEYLFPLAHPQLLHCLSALLFVIIAVVTVYKLANGAVFLLLVAATAPLTYQFLSILWQLSPAEKWDQVKLLVSLVTGVFVSGFLMKHLEETGKIASVLLGSLLIAASVQYLYEDGTYLGGFSKCLGSPEEGWDASECSPFFISWLGLMVLTAIGSIYSATVSRRPATLWVTPRAPPEMTVPRESPYVRLESIEEQRPRGMWSSIKHSGEKVRQFLGEKFTDADIVQVPPGPERRPSYERVP